MENKTTRRISVTFHQAIGVIPQKPFTGPYSYIIRNVPHNGTYFPAGMKVWHHKTQHPRFRYGLPLILCLHISLIPLVLYYF